jgi:hypothetical protein
MVSVGGGIAIAVVVLAAAAAIGWYVFTQMRARKLGVSHPVPAIAISASLRGIGD